MMEEPKVYDLIVCGAGHAGCEAALAAAGMGKEVLLLTGNLDTVAQMSCNPAIGGLGKGHMVREIDALGGQMALNTDTTAFQFRLLNASKGAAVRGPRAQCDKRLYQLRMKHVLETQARIRLFQALVESLKVEKGKVVGVQCQFGLQFRSRMVVLTTGTFLGALLHVGQGRKSGGRMGDFASMGLSKDLLRLGIELSRFKTGTPPRVLGSSIDFKSCREQPSDERPTFFAFYDTRFEDSLFHVEQFFANSCAIDALPEQAQKRWRQALFHVEALGRPASGVRGAPAARGEHLVGWLPGSQRLSCWETQTNEQSACIVRENLGASPLYAGRIEGTGPRYCPSIEDKVVRFSQRLSHHVFLEPEGLCTREWYVNGLSTSLPFQVQEDLLRSIEGMRRVCITRPAYAVEYDYAPPTQLLLSLESKKVENLFFAGQINGSSGYEEAAAQGLVAGINAVCKINGSEPLILGRHEAYIGVLIDDLVRKGTDEPFRMFTSRAEHRLSLNHNSAELRLLPHAQHLSLLPTDRLKRIEAKHQAIEHWRNFLEENKQSHHTYGDLLRAGKAADISLPQAFQRLPENIREEVLYRVNYKFYLQREERLINKIKQLEKMRLPTDFPYKQVVGLRQESLEKLQKAQPETLAHASSLSGINPVDIQLISIFLHKHYFQTTPPPRTPHPTPKTTLPSPTNSLPNPHPQSTPRPIH